MAAPQPLSFVSPIVTSRGDKLNDADGYVATFVVDEVVPAVEADAEKKTKEVVAHSIVTTGNCDGLSIHAETGSVGMFAVLKYIDILRTDDMASLKRCMALWLKKPTAVQISGTLLRRDRGTSDFATTDDIFVHPTQLLSNVEVGASTRTWLVSLASFATSYHQITRAYEQSTGDFLMIDEHIEALRARVHVLNSRTSSLKLIQSALSATKPPYPDLDYSSVAQEVITRLALFARTDLMAFKNIKKTEAIPKKVAGSGQFTGSRHLSTDQLRFLKDVAATNGDLWFERSAHTYQLGGEQNGVVVVFPSGYLYSVVGTPGTSLLQLMKPRTSLSRMESLIPYLPYELSGYTGDISKLALLEAQARKGAPSKVFAKVDLETAKAAIASYATRLATAVIVDPQLMDLMKKVKPKAPAAPSSTAEAVPDTPPCPPAPVPPAPQRKHATPPPIQPPSTPGASAAALDLEDGDEEEEEVDE